MNSSLPTFLMALSFIPSPSPASFWSAKGHHAVAALAWERLTPATRTEVRRLLQGDDFVHSSTWADSIRPTRRETAPFHYVNIPIWEPRFDRNRHCPESHCVIGAIERYEVILADGAKSDEERAEALRFLIHFVGDIHQPLHAGDRSDRGGNDVEVYLEGERTNLHRVWDRDVVDVLAPDETALIAALESRLSASSPDSIAAWTTGSPADWAWEGQGLSRTHVYRLPPDGRIGREYLTAQSEVVTRALLRACVRLAEVLNRALDR